ncbi:hypothetical protein NP233_g2570 [Leucocoprinus birnbaumii]|uniref:Velvet domain-containing protein n=1 Tax=Leucocoprinus birnbaumii TaxID=56174 RepID=A0AAD5W4C5_9AGAR|nr:hypothetical protein NP233_g2570 [Leucocoprinus birnbaumii]
MDSQTPTLAGVAVSSASVAPSPRDRLNTPHHARIYELIVRQEPKQARMCGVGGKADRRPIDPPPIVQLRVIDPLSTSSSNSTSTGHNMSSSSHSPPSSPPPPATHSHYPNHEPGPPTDAAAYAQSYLQNPYYFMFASLAKPDDDTELHWLKDGRTRCTTGSVVSSLYHLKDPQHNNEDAGFFVFPDLSVRTEGSYRLKLSLFEVVGNNVRHCKSIYSAPFYVYTAKKFPGMEESTPLSCSLADQGIKIRIRKDIRVRKRPNPAMEQPMSVSLTSTHQQYPSNALPSSSNLAQAGSQLYDERDDGGDTGKNKRHRTEEYNSGNSGGGVMMNVNMGAGGSSMNVMGGLGMGMGMDGSSNGASMHQYQQPSYPQSHQQGTWPPQPPPSGAPQIIPPPPGASGIPPTSASSTSDSGPNTTNTGNGGSTPSVIPPPQGNTPGRLAMGVTIPAGMDLGGPSVYDGRGGGYNPQPFDPPAPVSGPTAGPPSQAQAPPTGAPPPPYPTSPSVRSAATTTYPPPPPSQQQPYPTMQQQPPQQQQIIPPPPPPQAHPHPHQQPQPYAPNGSATTPGGYGHPPPHGGGPPHYGAPPYTGSSSNGGTTGQMSVDQQWNPGGPTGHPPQPQAYEGYYSQQPQPQPQPQQQYGPAPVPQQQRYDYASYPPQPPQPQQQQPGYGGYYDQQQQHYGGYAYQAPQPQTQPQPQPYQAPYNTQGHLTSPSGQQPQYDYGHQHQQQPIPPPPAAHHPHAPPPPQHPQPQAPYQHPHPQPPPNPYQHAQAPPVMQHQQQQVYGQPAAPHSGASSTPTAGPPSSIPPPPGATFLGNPPSNPSSAASTVPNASVTSPTARQPSNTAIYHQTQQTSVQPPSYPYGQYTPTSPPQQPHTSAPSGTSQPGPPPTGYGASSTGSSPEWNGYTQHHQQAQQQWTSEGFSHASRGAQLGPDRIQLAPLRHHSSALSVATSSAGASPVISSAHNGSTPDAHAASYSVIQLRSPGRDNNKMLPPPSDFSRDRDRRGSLTDQRGAGKKNPLSIGSIISNSNDK